MKLSVWDCNKTFALEGKTLKGKNRIKEHGTIWLVVDVRRVQCFNNDYGALIVSVQTEHARWIRAENDADFNIITRHIT